MFNFKKSLIPYPKHIEDYSSIITVAAFGSCAPFLEYDSTNAVITEAAAIVNAKLKEIGGCTDSCTGYKIIFSKDAAAPEFSKCDKEAYFIRVGEKSTLLCGADDAGVLYAAVTFCSMLHCVGDDVCIPSVYIYDYPDFKCRGHFMECRYGSEFMTRDDWFRVVDYMASLKLNQLTIGVYGCWETQYDGQKVQYLYVPINKYPQLKTLKNIKYYSVKNKKWVYKDKLLPTMFEEDFFGDIIAYAKRKNITVKPLFNSLGHNTLISEHFPEIMPVGKDGSECTGGFCTSNEKTYEIMFDIYDELIDRYLLPNDIADIEIGLDEVPDSYVCHCEKCGGTPFAQRMIDYIVRLCRHLKERGMKRIYIYHDMLYHHFDAIDDTLKQRFIDEGIYDVVVMDWWSYEDPRHLFLDKADGVNNIFHSVVKPFTGYYHWSVPTDSNENIHACTKLAKELDFEGVEAYGSFEHCFDKNYMTLADVAWNSEKIGEFDDFNMRYASLHYPNADINEAIEAFENMAEIMKDDTGDMYMNKLCYRFDYYYYSYKKDNCPYPRKFPQEVFELIHDDEKTFIPYLKFIKEKSRAALGFFENADKTQINDIWLLIARQYYTMADEYLSLLDMESSVNAASTDNLKCLERLIAQRESLMYMAENTRISATSYTYLRNMSVFRQLFLDLRDFLASKLATGENVKLDLRNLDGIFSKKMDFLR